MNIAELAIKKSTITIFLTVLLVVGGLFSYAKLGRYEDPEYTIKQAIIVTQYPGASPQEVEQRVTDVIEAAVQSMGQIDEVKSISYPEQSIVYAEAKDKYAAKDLPQIWDELRRKVNDCKGHLPPGITPVVNDDFGDVYGMLFAVTGEGYTYREIKDYVDYIRKEILLIEGVAKVDTWGMPQEKIYINISNAVKLGIARPEIFETLRKQDIISPMGDINIGDENIRLYTTGGFKSIEEIGDILVSDDKTGKSFRLKDIATIKRDYDKKPIEIMRFNNQSAIAFGISNAEGVNVVELGKKVKAKLKELAGLKPAGMEINSVYFQPGIVTKALDSFIVNLIEAIAIVIAILMVFMGLRSGILIGTMLLIIICGTFLFMKFQNIDLHRMSLGALIIALGMLVDNAIVITDGILVRIQQGMEKLTACNQVVKQTTFPLLGATVIAILAFAGIGFSPDSMGEYCSALYRVVLISLSISWVLAITVMPFMCYKFLKVKKEMKDAYDNRFYRGFRRFLEVCIDNRWKSLTVMIAIIMMSFVAFSKVSPAFFPTSSATKLTLDYWLPEGTKIHKTTGDLKKIEKWLLEQPEVDSVSTWTGRGALRFMIVYYIEDPNSGYGQLIINFKSEKGIPELKKRLYSYVKDNFLDARIKIERLILGMPMNGKVEVRVIGKDSEQIREFSKKIKTLMQKNKNATYIRTDWRQQVKVLKPVFSQEKARKAGVTRADLNRSLYGAFNGVNTGYFYEGNIYLPIVAQLPDKEADSADDLRNIQVYSSVKNQMIPIEQVISGIDVQMQDSLIKRLDRYRVITVSCDPIEGVFADTLRKELKKDIDKMTIPEGIKLEWGGEYEGCAESQAGVNASMPYVMLGMFTILVLLFNGIKQPVLIYCCLPLAVTGVAAGLLVTNTPFEFMAFLGFFSLIGMLIKNAIMIIDQIDFGIKQGQDPYNAIINAAIIRTRPVSMAAFTTVLGVIPLMWDVFFKSLAVVIIFGLSFATLLTLCFVPVLYSIFFGIRQSQNPLAIPNSINNR